MTEDPMKTLLRQMFNGWVIHDASFDAEAGAHLRKIEECMIEACGGDVLRGHLLVLFGEWANDVEGIAAHYGLRIEGDIVGRRSVHEDVPPAPSLEHWWDDLEKKWVAPEAESDEIAKVEM